MPLLPARRAIATLAYHHQHRFISRHSMFWRHLSNAAKLMLTSTPSTGTDLNASADPTFFLSSAQQTHRLFCRTVYSWQTRNRFFSASQNKQLVVIKTEREARGEKRVTGMSEKKKKKKLLGYHERRKKNPKIVPSFVIEETSGKDLQKKVGITLQC